jgi:hypothetical protein
MRGAPQVGFSATIRKIKARSSSPLFHHFQNRRLFFNGLFDERYFLDVR